MSQSNNKAPCVYAVITQWNGYNDTTECIRSLLASDYNNLKIVIVDNGSTDNSAELLAELYPDLSQVHTGNNGAVTAAYNAGINFGLKNGADYILMLNNDTTFDPKMVSFLVKVAEEDPSIGIVTPKTYYYDRPEIIWFAGGMRSKLDFGAYETYEGEFDTKENSQPKEVDYAWASGMLMRRELLDKMGLFDTQFYLYYDDVDTSIRTQQAGYRIWYAPEAKMWHKVSHSTGNEQFTHIWARSKMRLYRKHTHGLHQLFLIFYVFSHAIFRAIIPRQDNMRMNTYPKAYIKGLIDGLRS